MYICSLIRFFLLYGKSVLKRQFARRGRADCPGRKQGRESRKSEGNSWKLQEKVTQLENLFFSEDTVLKDRQKSFSRFRSAQFFTSRLPKNRKSSLTCTFIGVVAAARIAHGFFISITGPVLPSLAYNCDVSVGDVSSVFSWKGLGNVGGAIAGGIVFPRLRSGKVSSFLIFTIVKKSKL